MIRSFPALAALILTGFGLLLAGCSAVEEATRQATESAVEQAVEREMSALIAGYTEPMLYQLAHTQVFHLGGYGLHHDDFEEGQGATWQVESVDDDEMSSYTAERALLERLDDGTSWWYLKYTPEDADPVEYEVRIDPNQEAREMYLRDPESGDIRHHEFRHDEAEMEETAEGEETLDEAGYRTDYRRLSTEEWSEYREEQVTLQVGAGTFDADLLLYTADDPDEDAHSAEYRWWVTEDVPGHLIQYEFSDTERDSQLRGEMTDLRDGYVSTLRSG